MVGVDVGLTAGAVGGFAGGGEALPYVSFQIRVVCEGTIGHEAPDPIGGGLGSQSGEHNRENGGDGFRSPPACLRGGGVRGLGG
jgi:hypothetical protein